MAVRSLLFVPGDSERKLAKAESTQADVLILDLEDSVTSDRAEAARGLVREFLGARPAGARRQPVWVRCKPLEDDGTLADLAAVVDGHPDAFLVPKVRNGSDLVVLDHYLSALEVRAGITRRAITVAPTLSEHPRSLIEAQTFTSELPRLVAMSWGPIDLMSALGAATNRNPDGSFETLYAWARGLCIVTARSAGVDPIDTISADFRDLDALRADCVLARDAGFVGKLAIHPDQIPVINACFTPSDEDVKRARRIVEAFAATSAGVVAVDGQMMDRPHLKQALGLLARAESTAARS